MMKKIEEIIQISKGKKPKLISKVLEKGLMPYVDIKAFEQKIIDNYTDGEKCLPCEDGDLLIVCDGSRSGLIGRAIKGYVGSTLAKIEHDSSVDKDYLFYFVQGKYALLNTKKKGTGTPHINAELLKESSIYLPDLAEQRRIVTRIEELFSQLDSGVETLKKTKEQLKVYRQAVLKEAFAFKLSNMIEIREIVDDIRIGPFGTMLHKSDYIDNGVPVINPQHIKNLTILESNKITVSNDKAKELSAYRLKCNDIIMGRRGEMGRTAAISEREDGWICGTGSILFRLKLDYDAAFFAQILSSPDVIHYLEAKATGTTMKNLNEEIVKHIPVPNITKYEQQKITNMLDSKLSVCDSIEKTIDTALQEAEALRQSILKKAFEGAL